MTNGRKIIVSAPCKVHLWGEHAVVYGKPALLTSVNLRVYATISRVAFKDIPSEEEVELITKIQKVIEPIVKKYLKLKKLPIYHLAISSEVPIGSGLGSSAAISAAYIGALLSYLRVGWNLNLINELTFKAEGVFHGNPSGADNSTVVFGGLIWFRKESPELKLISKIPFKIPSKLTKNLYLIHTGKPEQTTKDMVVMVKNLYDKKPKLINKFLENQEKLVKELLISIRAGQEEEIIRIIKEGQKNLESIRVVSKYSQEIIRKIEESGGAAKICGAGAITGPTGVLLMFHKNRKVVENVAKLYNLTYFSTKLGVEGVRKEK